ncbi:ATP-binding cassette domain-containing protein [Mesorhizobium kowhaii]|uniref:ABC transporter permease subunit n=1 Tax=Mesorhizobium kowhaii TaxID=1300272 RepID=UPI0035E6F002
MSSVVDNHTGGFISMLLSKKTPFVQSILNSSHGKALGAIFAAAIAILIFMNFSLADQLKWTLWVSFGIVALSLSFIWGKAGIFSFGQNALFGIGAYGYAIVSLNVFPYTGETLSALILAAAAAAVFAAALGYFMFYGRVGDVYLSVLTLAVTLILYTVVSSTAGPEYRIGEATLGGFNGMPGLPTLAFWIPGLGSVELQIQGLLVFAVILAAVLYVAASYAADSRLGEILSGVRENETRMELLGYDVRFWKWLAFVIGGAIAGIGGGLFAAWGTFTNPSVFGLTQAAMVIIWVMIGGRTSLFGAFVGVVIVQWIADQADQVVAEQTPLILGLMLILSLFLLPSGVVPTVSRWLKSKIPATNATLIAEADKDLHAGQMADTALADHRPERGVIVAQNLAKSFGGLSVLRGVDLTFDSAPVYAIIGPNGAGKSTFFNVLTGRVTDSEGCVTLNGTDVTRMPAFERARLGLGIKLQIASVFPSMTVRQHIDLALRSRPGANREQLIRQTLQLADLLHRAEDCASDLSHGQQQWLEIAMVIAQNPSIILLDEPAAGMSWQEKVRTAKLIERLSRLHRIIVIEHDMAFVRSLQAPVAMLHQGRVFRNGGFDEVCSDDEVINIYLGRRSNAVNA